MIPDHYIDKGVDALISPARTTDTVPDWRLDAYRDTVQRIVEAVAADIWDEGHRTRVQRGPDGCTCNAWNEDECACGEYGTGPIVTPNPYRASATA